MTAPSPITSTPTSPPACACGRAEPSDNGRAERIARMKRLAKLGMRLAERVVEQAEMAEPSPDAPDPAERFARVARAVQQATDLEERLANPRPPRGESGERRAPSPKPPETTSKTATEAGYVPRPERQKFDDVVDAVHEMIARTDSPMAADRAEEDILAEVDNTYDEIDLRHRPTGELIAEVCQTLAISPDWSLFEDRPWIADARRMWAEQTAQAP